MSRTFLYTPDPKRLLELADQDGSDPVSVVWVTVTDGRHEYAAALAKEAGDRPVVPLVVNIDGFQNPNALFADLARLIVESRDVIGSRLAAADFSKGPLYFILVSRSGLSIPQAASPLVLPHWLPEVGGQTLSCRIKDAGADLEAMADAPEANVEQMRELLFRFEEAFQRRLKYVLEADPSGPATERLADLFRDTGKGAEDLPTFLAHARQALQEVGDARSFRPSVREGIFFVTRLIRYYGKTGSDKLPSAARVIVDGLRITYMPKVRGLIPTLMRSTNRAGESEYFAALMLSTLHCAYQLITTAAHPDGYPKQPVLVISACSYDLRRTMAELIQSVDQ